MVDREQLYFEITKDEERTTLQGMLSVLAMEAPHVFTPPERAAAHFRLKAYLERLLQGGRVGAWDYARETGGWIAGAALTPEQNKHGQMLGRASQLINMFLTGQWKAWRGVDMEDFVCVGQMP